MDRLDHVLWDETVAGPPPDSDHGKPAKLFSFPSSPSAAAVRAPVTRSITIARNPRPSLTISPRAGEGADFGSTPSSPASEPNSPLAMTPRGVEFWKRRAQEKRKANSGAAAEGGQSPATVAEPRSPTVYDWVVISSLDR